MLDESSDSAGFEESLESLPAIKIYKKPSEEIRQFKESMQGSLPLVSPTYSLEPDMLLGWRPKIESKSGPIPLNFDYEEFPIDTNADDEEYDVLYHGFRPNNSLLMHQTFSDQGAYKFPLPPSLINSYQSLWKYANSKPDPRPFVGMSPKVLDSDLHFDSCFESGNLDKVVKIGTIEYDLYMRADANTNGHYQWFYFSVSNIKFVRDVRFNILNFHKKESLFNQGMRVCMKSDLEVDWVQVGTNLTYTESKLNKLIGCYNKYYTLSFSHRLTQVGQKVYFAYTIPYPYSRLLQQLQILRQYERQYLIQETLCSSLSGIDVPLLTITDFSTGNYNEKDHIFITGRVHPGETYGSWVLEGLLQFLVSKTELAAYLRQRLVFKIVPMLNPDGVIMGNYRTSFAGNDLNRRFKDTEPSLHPIVYCLKHLIQSTAESAKIMAYIDIHAHSLKKGAFMYGPYYPLHKNEYFKVRMFPRLFSEKTDMFRYYSCKFKSEKSKRRAARLVISKLLGLHSCYTLETSSCGYISQDRQNIPFNEDNLLLLGRTLGETVHDYVVMIDEQEKARQLNHKIRAHQLLRPPTGQGPVRQPQPPVLQPRSINKSYKTIMNQLKEEAPAETYESDSGGSDSNPSGDELAPEIQKALHSQIKEVLDQFSTTDNKSRVEKLWQRPRSQNRKGNAVQMINQPVDFDSNAQSTLAVYFSQADKYRIKEPRKSSLSNYSAKDSLSASERDTPTGPRPVSSNNPRFRIKRRSGRMYNSHITQPSSNSDVSDEGKQNHAKPPKPKTSRGKRSIMKKANNQQIMKPRYFTEDIDPLPAIREKGKRTGSKRARMERTRGPKLRRFATTSAEGKDGSVLRRNGSGNSFSKQGSAKTIRQ